MRTVSITALLAGAFGCSGGSTPPIEGCPGCKIQDAGPRARADAGADGGAVDAGPAADAGPSDSGVDSGLPLTGQVCPAGSLMLNGETTDACAGQSFHANVPLPGVQVATLQPYSAAVSDASGLFTICLPPNSPSTLVFTLPGYVTAYEAEFEDTPLLPPTFSFEAQMLCDAALQIFAFQEPRFDSRDPAVFSEVLSVSLNAPCDTDDGGYVGWSVHATLLDGGIEPGGPWPVEYLDFSGDLLSIPASTGRGDALIFNIDPAVEYVTVTATNPAVGNDCPTLDPDIGFTGRMYVAPGAVSFYPWLVP